ncbi:MAG: alpha/beta hydrolase, partial [Rhodothermales bacterium]|nr:alpha/beta hydrolase [Rhodothermales bacterium]
MKGTLTRHSDFGSAHVGKRHVEVWIPENAGSNPLPVLYMQDGQNLFHAGDAFAGVTWGVAEMVSRLISEEGLPPVMVVGIWNTHLRIPEYMPQKPLAEWADPRVLERFAKTYGGEPCSDAYLRFMVDELKPFIDREYNTRPEANSTWLMGSSMGGLISLYGVCEYPEV